MSVFVCILLMSVRCVQLVLSRTLTGFSRGAMGTRDFIEGPPPAVAKPPLIEGPFNQKSSRGILEP